MSVSQTCPSVLENVAYVKSKLRSTTSQEIRFTGLSIGIKIIIIEWDSHSLEEDINLYIGRNSWILKK